MLLKNFYRFLAVREGGLEQTLKDISGTDRTFNLSYCKGWCRDGKFEYSSSAGRVDSPEGDTNYGIVVGTSDTPVTPDDYYINKIAHGTSSGQLYYHATEVKDVVVSGDVIELEVTRKLSNQTPDDITVNEFGLIAKIGNYYFLIAREVSPTVVPSQGLLEVSFKFKTTV